MRITNNYREKVYWRAFASDDTKYLVGLKQGEVAAGSSDSWREDSYPTIKVEIKLGDIIFSSAVLASAGAIYQMSDDLVVTPDGQLAVATVTLRGDRGQTTEKRSDIQFVDLRGFSAPAERTVRSFFEAAFASTQSVERSSGHEQTWTVGGKIGGILGGGEGAPLTLGGGLPASSGGKGPNVELSAQFQDKVTNALRSTSTQAVSAVWSQMWSDKLRLAGGKLYVIEVVWTLTLDRGTAHYLGEQTPFSVVRSATPSLLKPTEYESHEDLPPAYRERWEKQTEPAG